ncbi:MAG: GntR family transcriptional regulator [Anaerohalosphaeraceae bacterium]|nr:GntR family transcriptional regulator [Anaerohalosphaeraceae bacterium]
MEFRIDNTCDRAVYQQIIDQVKRQIAIGSIAPDDKLPTVRALAVSLVINPNTIAKAYRQLEREGIISTRPGLGTFVAKLSSNLSTEVKEHILTEKIETVVIDAVHMGVNKKTLSRWFEKAVEKFKLDRLRE